MQHDPTMPDPTDMPDDMPEGRLDDTTLPTTPLAPDDPDVPTQAQEGTPHQPGNPEAAHDGPGGFTLPPVPDGELSRSGVVSEANLRKQGPVEFTSDPEVVAIVEAIQSGAKARYEEQFAGSSESLKQLLGKTDTNDQPNPDLAAHVGKTATRSRWRLGVAVAAGLVVALVAGWLLMPTPPAAPDGQPSTPTQPSASPSPDPTPTATTAAGTPGNPGDGPLGPEFPLGDPATYPGDPTAKVTVYAAPTERTIAFSNGVTLTLPEAHAFTPFPDVCVFDGTPESQYAQTGGLCPIGRGHTRGEYMEWFAVRDLPSLPMIQHRPGYQPVPTAPSGVQAAAVVQLEREHGNQSRALLLALPDRSGLVITMPDTMDASMASLFAGTFPAPPQST